MFYGHLVSRQSVTHPDKSLNLLKNRDKILFCLFSSPSSIIFSHFPETVDRLIQIQFSTVVIIVKVERMAVARGGLRAPDDQHLVSIMAREDANLARR